jgi:diphosphomevalonate decarboxylase
MSKIITYQSPSNIALIKYWGKHGNQLPNNPSISFSLSNSKTITSIEYKKAEANIEFYFEDKRNLDFEKRIKTFLNNNKDILAFINDYSLKISSKNTFPHSAGIASSASAFSALSACLISIKQDLGYKVDNFEKEVSTLARLGSGSASRSVYEGVVLWGKTDLIKNSSNEYAIPINDNIHDIYKNYHDDILIVEEETKSVSSSAGHKLMDTNPYRTEKYNQSNINLKNILSALKTGDLDLFINIVENEALALHAMMMISEPSFILMKPKTLEIINAVRNFRQETKIPLCFTLDAGPNVHLLYPDRYFSKIQSFIKTLNTKNIINDFLGNGILQV